jgi:hypothetical protein
VLRFGAGRRVGQGRLAPRLLARLSRLLAPAPERSSRLGAAGNSRAYFRRAIERGNLVVAKVTAREIGRISLVEALELTALVARHDPKRHRRYAPRWLWRYLGESESITIDDDAVAVGLLLALGGERQDEAFLALLGMAEQSSSDLSPTALRRGLPASRGARPRAGRA